MLLNKTTITTGLSDQAIELTLFDSIDSTSRYLKNQASNGQIKICLAEQQTQGKGQRGQVWTSPFAKNIYLSLRYRFYQPINQLPGLSLAISHTVHQIVQQFCPNADVGIKWPNDIIANHKKLAGILVEVASCQKNQCELIIGIGINVNMLEAKAIERPWISMQQLQQKAFDRNHIVIALIKRLLLDLAIFADQGFNAFISAWQQNDYLYNKQIEFFHNDQLCNGIAKGITAQGHLVVKRDNDKYMEFASGEIRKIRW